MSLPRNNPDFSIGLAGITNFPGRPGNSALENTDLFPSLFDLPSELVSASERFNLLRTQPPGPTTQREIAELLDILGPYIITPETFNKLTASMSELQYMWHTEIHAYIRRMQDQLKFIGEWNSTTEYQLHNKVSRPQSGQVDPSAGELFICINRNGSRNNPLPLAPSFQNEHWRRISTSSQGAPGIAVNFLGDWANVQGITFEIGDGVRFNGVEYYCRVSTDQSPSSLPSAWETFWPIIWVNGDTDARPNNGSMRQNTILYRTHEGSTFVEQWHNGEWIQMMIRTNASSVEIGSGRMLPQELASMRGATATVQSNLDDESLSIRNLIGPLDTMAHVTANNRGTAATAINWTAGRTGEAHEEIGRHNTRINALENVDNTQIFLSKDGRFPMTGNLRMANGEIRMNVNGVERTIIQGGTANNLHIGSAAIPGHLALVAPGHDVRVWNGTSSHTVVHGGNLSTTTVNNSNHIGGHHHNQVARQNNANTFTTGQTINGTVTVGGDTSRVRSNSGTLTLGSGGSNSLVLNGNNATVAGSLTTGAISSSSNISASGWVQGRDVCTNAIFNHAGSRAYMTTTNGSFADFPHAGGLAIQGRRLFIQNNTPSGGRRGDVWLQSF